MKQNWIDNHCDGSGPHSGNEVRLYPLGGDANLILCLSCWAKENRYRHDMGRHYNSENFPQHNWYTAKLYATKGDANK